MIDKQLALGNLFIAIGYFLSTSFIFIIYNHLRSELILTRY